LGVSGATLRRRLSVEKTTLRSAVTEARLSCAMELLYTTRWPIKTVAARVGYRSSSTFVRRFTERYGMEPGHIGNAA
jgi:AraC-like DNA-binding protein